MNREEWLLIAIGDGIEPIQLQKTMFKFAKESGVPKGEAYSFVPYSWGPCSFEIYDDLGTLREQGKIEALPSGRGWNLYRLAPAGEKTAKKLRDSAHKNRLGKLDEIRDWVKSRTFRQLLSEVYAQYPEFATNSRFTK